jgi:ABC-2 type transport system ATP-binding protein
MLTVTELSKSYGALQVLDHVSFEVRPGRIVGFLGPNGAGKTTTMRSVFGLVRPDDGSVEWDGQAVDHAARQRFGYMPEQRGLYPRMRIHDQLAYLARLSGMDASGAEDAANSWLERLGLADRSGNRLEELSHGNQQRVQLAAALVHEPVLAVLDEPFSGLDPIGVEAMAAELRAMARRGVAIVFSSHQLDLVEDVCQDVVIIDEGRVVRTGVLTELREGATTRRLMVAVDGRPWRPTRVDTMPAGDSDDDGVLVPASVPAQVLLDEAGEHGSITSFSYEPPTLTDIFREAVAR